jgi:hypothetical protein
LTFDAMRESDPDRRIKAAASLTMEVLLEALALPPDSQIQTATGDLSVDSLKEKIERLSPLALGDPTEQDRASIEALRAAWGLAEEKDEDGGPQPPKVPETH